MKHHDQKVLTIGVIGTGFISRHFILELMHHHAYRLGKVLTRRPLASFKDFPVSDVLTQNIEELIEASDIILECSGDVFWATIAIGRALAAGRPVLTLNPEFHVTTGSYFVGKGLLTEADGDQPGCMASLWEEAVMMGFKPLVLGNIKGFLNRTPTDEEMRFWASKQGISLPMVTSFTDGTKLQIEQALVGNFFGADIVQNELLGPATDNLQEASSILGEIASKTGSPIVDYVLSRNLPHGVFVVAQHKAEQKDALHYLKLGEGPYYTLLRPNIFIHLEVFKTLERIVRGGSALLHNSSHPRLSVAAVAKIPLDVGTIIKNGYGSYQLRGICIRMAEYPRHLPIGLANDLHFRRKVEPGQIIDFSDVDLLENEAVRIWQMIS